jgi:16S rRNA (guanine527-N7)-methyltransferase
VIQKEALTKTLQQGLAVLKVAENEVALEKLITYIETLHKWNAVHNLTAIRDPLEMVTKHLLDSLVLAPYLNTGRVIDVGTGAGLPGIPLAISNPTQKFVLLDSNQKKMTFVEHMILSLKLVNSVAVCARVEQYQPEQPFDWVVSRAFSSLADFVRVSAHLCKPSGRLVAMKGLVDPAEIAEIDSGWTIESIKQINVPGLNAARSLVFMAPNSEKRG